MFNTLKYARMLEEVGFSREQSETSIKILVEIMEDKFATKQDLLAFESRITTELHHSIALVESKMTIRMGAMLAASIAILTAIQKLV